MNKNLLIEIFVPTTDGSDVGIKATGYPVGARRIITARHVLFPNNRDETKPIEVRWYHQTGQAAIWRQITRIAWDGDDRFDCALIDCEFPQELPDYGMLSAEKPADGMNWVSEGFARAGRKDDGSRNPVPMLGEAHSAADTDPTFHVGVRYSTTLDQGWKGASGSPIFVDNKIIGVVISCPENFYQVRLLATPTWKLLQVEKFRREIGYDDRVKRLASIKGKIADALRRSPAAVAALDEDSRTLHQSLDVRAHTLAGVILDLRIEQVLSRAKKAYKSLMDRGQGADAAAVREAANLVVPALFDEGVVEGLRSRKSDVGFALVPLPVAQHAVGTTRATLGVASGRSRM